MRARPDLARDARRESKNNKMFENRVKKIDIP